MKRVFSYFLILINISFLLISSGCSNSSNASGNKVENNVANSIKNEYMAGTEKVQLERVGILSDKVDILLPKSFNIMSEEMAKKKYPSENRPTLIYTNDSASINIAFNHTQNKATNRDISEYLNSIKNTFTNLYPSAKWYKSNVENINGKNIGILELLTPAIDTEVYNLMYFTDLDGRLLISSFNCTKEQMDDWKPIAKGIMDSQIFK